MVKINGQAATPARVRALISPPPKVQREYHGNGPGAWTGDGPVVLSNDTDTDTVERFSCRYSYRWHRTVVRVNGLVPTARTYARLRQRYLAG